MSVPSEVVWRRASDWAVLAAALVATAAVAGCGRKAPPLPPIVRVAEQTRDLRAVQQGSEIILRWSYPALTTTGAGLRDIEEVELWRATLPLAQEPQGTTQRDRDIRVQLLKAQGERLLVLDPVALNQATRGAELQVVDDLERWRDQLTVEGDPLLWYAVRTVCCGGRRSAFSNIARVQPQQPPEPPTWVTAEGTRDGVALTWTQSAGLATIVERSADGTTWEVVTPQPVSEQEWRDPSAAQGEVWHYRLRSDGGPAGGGRVLGQAGEVRVVQHPDVYPPAAPDNVVCLPEGKMVRVRWSLADKKLRYRVSRSLGERPPVLLSGAAAGPEYVDPDPPYGRLRYDIQAVDDAGNPSPAASCGAVVGAAP